MFGFLKPHLKPLQKPHPPIGVAGLSKNSDTLKMAGEHGFLPLSLNLNPAYVGTPLGRGRGGRRGAPAARPTARDWRMVREVFVAETDAEAYAPVGRRHDGPHDAANTSCRCWRISASWNTSSTTRRCRTPM